MSVASTPQLGKKVEGTLCRSLCIGIEGVPSSCYNSLYVKDLSLIISGIGLSRIVEGPYLPVDICSERELVFYPGERDEPHQHLLTFDHFKAYVSYKRKCHLEQKNFDQKACDKLLQNVTEKRTFSIKTEKALALKKEIQNLDLLEEKETEITKKIKKLSKECFKSKESASGGIEVEEFSSHVFGWGAPSYDTQNYYVKKYNLVISSSGFCRLEASSFKPQSVDSQMRFSPSKLKRVDLKEDLALEIRDLVKEEENLKSKIIEQKNLIDKMSKIIFKELKLPIYPKSIEDEPLSKEFFSARNDYMVRFERKKREASRVEK